MLSSIMVSPWKKLIRVIRKPVPTFRDHAPALPYLTGKDGVWSSGINTAGNPGLTDPDAIKSRPKFKTTWRTDIAFHDRERNQHLLQARGRERARRRAFA